MVFTGVDPVNNVYFIRRFVKIKSPKPSIQVFPRLRRSDRKHIIDVKRKFVFATLCQRVKVGGEQFFDLADAVIYGVSMGVDRIGGCLHAFPVFEVEAEQGKIIRVMFAVITQKRAQKRHGQGD